MIAREKATRLIAVSLAAMLAAACSPAAAPAPLVDRADQSAAAAGAAEAPQSGAGPIEVASSAKSGLGGVGASPYRANRLILKNGEMSLLVAGTDRAIDQVTDIAVNSGGYIVSSRTWFDGEYKFATLTMGVPVEQFEAVQRQLRGVAASVLSDTASGQDVSEEYIDLQSRLTNLEATAARVREFLSQSKTVEEALKVNAQLSDIVSEIEQVKGRTNFLKDRAAFSTLVVNLEPQRTTPTPTPSPVTPWQPDRTFQAAGSALSGILRVLGDLVIWFAVVVAPFAVPAAIVATLVIRGHRRKARSGAAMPDAGGQLPGPAAGA